MGQGTKAAIRAVAILLFIVVILVGPTGYFYFKYMLPSTDMPAISADVGSMQASSTISDGLANAMQDALVKARAETGAPSFSAAVGFGNMVHWAGTTGYAHIEGEVPASLTSRYRLGSTSKALTGALLMRLVENGTMALDTPISAYVDDLPDVYAPLTPRQLASHIAGVRHYEDSLTYWPGSHPSFSNDYYETVRAGLDIFLDDPLLFPAGEGFSYSTYGYSLLSYAMEGASGQDFKDLMQEQLFDPLFMGETAFDLPGDMSGRVSFYVTGDGKYSPAYPTGASYKLAGGGVLANAADVARFGLALLGQDFLDEEAKETLFTPVALPGEETNPQNYALGFRVDTSTRLLGEDRLTVIIHHGGLQNGGVSYFAIVPAYGISVSVLANTGDIEARYAVQDLAYELIRLVVQSGI